MFDLSGIELGGEGLTLLPSTFGLLLRRTKGREDVVAAAIFGRRWHSRVAMMVCSQLEAEKWSSD